jgi:formamidopyrimidine-DNA glycosylase
MKRRRCKKCGGTIYELYNSGDITFFCEHCGVIGGK